MAISNLQPALPAPDLVTYKEAKRLFAETPYPVSEPTMRRWVKEFGISAEKFRGIVHVPYTDLLVAHGAWVAATTAAVP
ncbi:MerR family transcriptional regulator [Streptomyces cinereoruber]|uniref:hypothetical protein n=1 Tax=Streptomyces cinereoruber TaxID=67260 RepID=UPI003638D0F7